MTLSILEGLYYLVTIVVSAGFLRYVFRIFMISNKIEILLTSNPQRHILKLWFFIKFFLLYFFLCIYIVYFINSYQIGFQFIDFFTFSFVFFFFDKIYISLLDNTLLLKVYTKFVKKFKKKRFFFILLLSLVLTIITYYLGKIIDYDYKVISVSLLVGIIVFINVSNEINTTIVHSKKFILDYIFAFLFLTPLIIKILLIFIKNTIFHITDLVSSDIVEHICSIYYDENSKLVLLVLCLLSLLFAICGVSKIFYFNSFLIYKNRQWEIAYITVDKYAICVYNNYTFMINTDIIKNNYICENYGDNFYFREKGDIEENNITERL